MLRRLAPVRSLRLAEALDGAAVRLYRSERFVAIRGREADGVLVRSLATDRASGDEWASGLTFSTMTVERAQTLADTWHHSPPYDFYDQEADPEDYEEFVDPARWPPLFEAATDGDHLVGFLAADPAPDGPGTEIALGLRPDLTGGGRGLPFLQRLLRRVRDAGVPGPIVLDVAAFNERAVTVYRRAAFRPVSRFLQETNGGSHEFLRMRLDGRDEER